MSNRKRHRNPRTTSHHNPSFWEENDVYSFGPCRGSHQAKMFGHNLDFAGFIRLVQGVYSVMNAMDYHLPKKLPFCIFQHAMTEILTARMLALAEHQWEADALFKEFCIPLPIFEYINGIGKNTAPCGTQVDWNLPDAAIPQKRIEGEKPCRSGSFGIPTAANHNAYECYISPYITSEYVKRQAKVTEKTENLNWNPFPAGWLPADCEVNRNLLGYKPLEKLSIEGLNRCLDCTFADDDTNFGILCHSVDAMTMASSVVANNDAVKSVRAQFERTENLAIFVFKESNIKENLKAVLWQECSNMYSPHAASASTVNKSSYFDYKRKRNAKAPGVFALCNGKLIDGWLETINDNFECTGSFNLRLGSDNKGLRDAAHFGDCSEISDLSVWLNRIMILQK